jgi:hypothetical protein
MLDIPLSEILLNSLNSLDGPMTDIDGVMLSFKHGEHFELVVRWGTALGALEFYPKARIGRAWYSKDVIGSAGAKSFGFEFFTHYGGALTLVRDMEQDVFGKAVCATGERPPFDKGFRFVGFGRDTEEGVFHISSSA